VELSALFDNVQEASRSALGTGLERTVSTAAQLIARARATVDQALQEVQLRFQAEVAQAHHIDVKARESAEGALERYASRHAPPGSAWRVHLSGEPEGYAAQVTMVTPYALCAVFSAAVPPDHLLSRPRRAGDFVSALEVHLPREAGWLSRRVEVSPVRLEKLFVSEVHLGPELVMIRLTKTSVGGAGYEARVESREGAVRATMVELPESGEPGPVEPVVVTGEDEARLLALVEQIAACVRQLVGVRRRLLSGELSGQALGELDSPRAIADALIADMAPTVREISRRSGAPGELVLRRDQGEGRREETYCTHAELIDKILVLPPDLRAAFAPLDLSGPAAEIPASSGTALSSRAPVVAGAPPTGSGEALPSGPPPPPSRRPPSVPPPGSSPPAA
jgi:hypothetical protein